MTLFLLTYWIIMILWLFGYSYLNWGNPQLVGAGFAQWVLFLLLGIKVFPIALG